MDERVIKDMFNNIYQVFKDYDKIGLEADKKNNITTEILAWRDDLMEHIDDHYAAAMGYARLIRSDPEKFGFNPSELEDMVSEIERSKRIIDEEKQIEYPELMN